MKIFRILPVFLFFLCLQEIRAQDDETRQGTGLPILIGENSSNRARTPVSGKITIEGIEPSQTKPAIFVTVFFAGAQIDRRQANDAGFYYLPSVPRENAILAIEMDGIEVGRIQLQSSVMGSIRQDFTVNGLRARNAKEKTGVLFVKNFYQRTVENEKIFREAISEAKGKKAENSIKLFNELVARDPKDFIAWTELGTMFFRLNKYPDAEQAYKRALERKPDYIVAVINLGKLFLAQKQPDRSIVFMTKAIEIEPDSADAQHFLGEAYLQSKKGSMAVVHLNEALKLAPVEKAEIHLRLAALYNAANLKDRAAAEYKLFLEKIPQYAEREKIQKYIKDNSQK